MKYIDFTHNDLDGIVSGIAVKRMLGDVDVVYCSYKTIDAAIMKFLASSEFKEYDVIFITDISVKEETAKKLDACGIVVELYDHHDTALWLADKYDWATVRLNNEDGSPTCGAQLIFNELRLSLEYDKGLAEFVEIVRRWDTWEWKKLKDNTPMHFNLVFRTIGIEDFVKDYLNYFETLDMYNEALKELPEDSRISKVSVEFDMTQEHKLILKYKLHEMERYIYDKLPQVRIFEDEFKNSVAFVVADSHISELCDSVLDNKLCDYVCCFTGDTMSLRSREGFDVSAIAKHYGGGGRECTAGMPPIPYYIEKYVTILLYEV